MANLIADENFPRAVVEALRALNHDVTIAQDESLGELPDTEVLAFATAAGRSLLTHDRDFIKLHRTNHSHAYRLLHC